MNKRSAAAAALISVLIFLSAAAYYVIFLKHEKQPFPVILSGLEKELSNTAYDISDIGSLQSLDRRKLSPEELKQVSKRIYSYCMRTGNFALLESLIERYIDKYRDDNEIASLYLFSLIRNGKYNTALKFSNKSRDSSAVDSLKFEAYLLSGKDLSGEELPSGAESRVFFDAVNRKDETAYETLAENTGDYGFLIDAALLLLNSDRPSKAFSLLKNIPPSFKNRNVLLFRSAMESGNAGEALKLLESYDLGFGIADMKLYRADIFNALKQYGRSKKDYVDFIDLYPDYSWIPYADLAWIGIREKDKNLYSAVKRGIEYFHSDERFSSNLTDYQIFIGKKREAADYIESYCSDVPELKLVEYTLRGSMEPAMAIARIQEILLRNPENSQVGRYYCWFLFESGNIPLLEDYIAERKSKGELRPWEKFFEALIYAVNGKLDEAEDLLTESYNASGYWEILFDLAKVYQHERDYLKSVEFFQKAENSIDMADTAKRSVVRAELAGVLYEAGRTARAVKEAEYALKLDKNNIQALLLLKKLESESN